MYQRKQCHSGGEFANPRHDARATAFTCNFNIATTEFFTVTWRALPVRFINAFLPIALSCTGIPNPVFSIFACTDIDRQVNENYTYNTSGTVHSLLHRENSNKCHPAVYVTIAGPARQHRDHIESKTVAAKVPLKSEVPILRFKRNWTLRSSLSFAVPDGRGVAGNSSLITVNNNWSDEDARPRKFEDKCKGTIRSKRFPHIIKYREPGIRDWLPNKGKSPKRLWSLFIIIRPMNTMKALDKSGPLQQMIPSKLTVFPWNCVCPWGAAPYLPPPPVHGTPASNGQITKQFSRKILHLCDYAFPPDRCQNQW